MEINRENHAFRLSLINKNNFKTYKDIPALTRMPSDRETEKETQREARSSEFYLLPW